MNTSLCLTHTFHQSFLLFLVYTFIASIIGASMLAASFARAVTSSSGDPASGAAVAILVAAVLDAAFALALAGFMIMHRGLVSRNATTIEAYEKQAAPGAPWPYTLGTRSANWASVFGRHPARWFVPWYTRAEREVLLAGALAKVPGLGVGGDVEAGV